MNKQNKQLLTELYLTDQRKKYPAFPDHCRPPYSNKDNNANGLTKCVLDFLNYSGHFAERISSQGQARVKKATCGKTIGIEWTKGTSRVGTADISAEVKHPNHRFAIPVKIEIKYGKDRQSQVQKQYEIDVTEVGALYWIVKDFDSFIEKFNNFYQSL